MKGRIDLPRSCYLSPSWPNEAKFHNVFNTPYAPCRMPANSRGGLEADRRWRSISAATTAPPVGDRSEDIACFARALALGQTKPNSAMSSMLGYAPFRLPATSSGERRAATTAPPGGDAAGLVPLRAQWSWRSRQQLKASGDRNPPSSLANPGGERYEFLQRQIPSRTRSPALL